MDNCELLFVNKADTCSAFTEHVSTRDHAAFCRGNGCSTFVFGALFIFGYTSCMLRRFPTKSTLKANAIDPREGPLTPTPTFLHRLLSSALSSVSWHVPAKFRIDTVSRANSP